MTLSNHARCRPTTFLAPQNVRRAGVKNGMVIALDDDTRDNMERLGFPAFRMDLKVR